MLVPQDRQVIPEFKARQVRLAIQDHKELQVRLDRQEALVRQVRQEQIVLSPDPKELQGLLVRQVLLGRLDQRETQEVKVQPDRQVIQAVKGLLAQVELQEQKDPQGLLELTVPCRGLPVQQDQVGQPLQFPDRLVLREIQE